MSFERVFTFILFAVIVLRMIIAIYCRLFKRQSLPAAVESKPTFDRGLFIAFYGGSGSGKSYHADELVHSIDRRDVNRRLSITRAELGVGESESIVTSALERGRLVVACYQHPATAKLARPDLCVYLSECPEQPSDDVLVIPGRHNGTKISADEDSHCQMILEAVIQMAVKKGRPLF